MTALGVASMTLAITPVSRAADVNYFSASKGILFVQTNAAAPQLKTGLPYLFQAAVVAEPGGLSSASMQWPFGSRALNQRLPAGPYTYTDRQPTQELLDLFYPNGNFTFTLNTVHDGNFIVVLNLPSDINPVAPTLANFTAAQSINSSNNFTLQWGPFFTGTTNDFIHVRIDSPTGSVFRTAFAPGLPGALNAASNSVVIPAGTLPSGHVLAGRIIFAKILSTNVTAYPGAKGAVSYYTQTEFFIATAGSGDLVPPRLVSSGPGDGATGVAMNSPLAMNFSEPTRQSLSVFINGTIAGRTFAWNPDGTTLVATPTSNWPPSTTIGWVLNPSDALPFFGDLNNNPLAPETTLLFTTGTNAPSPAAPLLKEPMRLVNGRFQFKLMGESNRTYAAEATTNFVNWTSLGTNIAFSGTLQFLDTNAPVHPHRFYRGFAP